MEAKKAKFIVLEGGEGSGKSSLVIALKEILGDTAFFTREPGGSPYAEAIRETTLKNPLAKDAPRETTLCLMFAARFDNTKNALIPALERGLPVIADRFDASSYAYNVYAQADGAKDLAQCEEIFWNLRGRLPAIPDLYIFIDVDPEEGYRRANTRNLSLLNGASQYDHFDDREIQFHTKVRDGYIKFLKKVPHVIVDANRPFEEVKREFIEVVKKEIKM